MSSSSLWADILKNVGPVFSREDVEALLVSMGASMEEAVSRMTIVSSELKSHADSQLTKALSTTENAHDEYNQSLKKITDERDRKLANAGNMHLDVMDCNRRSGLLANIIYRLNGSKS